MPSVRLSIEAQLCGPASVGTVDVIKAPDSGITVLDLCSSRLMT